MHLVTVNTKDYLLQLLGIHLIQDELDLVAFLVKLRQCKQMNL